MTNNHEIFEILNSKYKHWETLYDLYDQVRQAYWLAGIDIFSVFCKNNKKNEEFINEFNKTSFNI